MLLTMVISNVNICVCVCIKTFNPLFILSWEVYSLKIIKQLSNKFILKNLLLKKFNIATNFISHCKELLYSRIYIIVTLINIGTKY